MVERVQTDQVNRPLGLIALTVATVVHVMLAAWSIAEESWFLTAIFVVFGLGWATRLRDQWVVVRAARRPTPR